MENWFLRQWYEKRQPAWYLRLLEPLYRHAYQYSHKKGQTGLNRYRSELPVIVVGNITAGGSGKTPLVIRLCELAREMNIRPGIASTGYGRQSSETLVVSADSDSRVCGDEPVLLAQRTGVPVVVAEKRCDAVRQLNLLDLDLVVSDDGLQQASLVRDMEICVIDGARGLGNGHLLPAGPLRETAARLGKVDFVVTNGEWDGMPHDIDASVMRLEASEVCTLDGKKRVSVRKFLQLNNGIPVQAVAGIGHPQRFFSMLETLGIEARTRGFPDHHMFSVSDFDSIPPGVVIVMTEKDAVKCRSLGLENAWYLPVDTHLPQVFETALKERLVNLIKETK